MKIKLTPKQKESRKMCKNIMQTTWKICRRAARKFGGLASQYFNMALQIVWRSYNAKQLDLFA
jgi:hypothetical protein